MDLVGNEYSRSSSPPFQIATSPETPTPAGKKRAGRKVLNETRHPFYRGVRRKNGSKWVCEVREPNKKSRIWLGTFPSPEAAAVAHDVAALALRGDHAPLNFPDAASRLPRPRSTSHHDIQRATIRVSQERKVVINSADTNPSGDKDDSMERSRVESSEDCWSCNQSPTSEGIEPGEVAGFVDEEAVFNMPALVDSMAKGMLLTPLAMKKGFNWSKCDDEGVELSLWVD